MVVRMIRDPADLSELKSLYQALRPKIQISILTGLCATLIALAVLAAFERVRALVVVIAEVPGLQR